jgi:hypothetical protein
MANTIDSTTVKRGNKQFQGAFKEMWLVTVTASFDTDIGADSGAEFSITATGVALGDMCIGIAPSGADPEPNAFVYQAQVISADTISLSIFNSGGLNTPLPTGFKILMARPNW